jgi:hypothetical protein
MLEKKEHKTDKQDTCVELPFVFVSSFSIYQCKEMRAQRQRQNKRPYFSPVFPRFPPLLFVRYVLSRLFSSLVSTFRLQMGKKKNKKKTSKGPTAVVHANANAAVKRDRYDGSYPGDGAPSKNGHSKPTTRNRDTAECDQTKSYKQSREEYRKAVEELRRLRDLVDVEWRLLEDGGDFPDDDDLVDAASDSGDDLAAVSQKTYCHVVHPPDGRVVVNEWERLYRVLRSLEDSIISFFAACCDATSLLQAFP